ncbi:MAG: hypothetical protein HC815_05870 [Richelia sp. RM1_1_1]|nr:hypothetical protein [Richelia sp. RM1_1_1]
MKIESNNQVAVILSNLKERLDSEQKDFYIESIADAGIKVEGNIGTKDIDRLLRFLPLLKHLPNTKQMYSQHSNLACPII